MCSNDGSSVGSNSGGSSTLKRERRGSCLPPLERVSPDLTPRSSKLAEVPNTPKWTQLDQTTIFLASLASYAEREGAVCSPPALATPFSNPGAQLSCSRMKHVARRISIEHSRRDTQHPATASPPSFPSVPRVNVKRNGVMTAQQWAAACTSLALDSSFLQPNLAVRAPRPKVAGVKPEDCFPPNTCMPCNVSPLQISEEATAADTPSCLASQLQACLRRSLDGFYSNNQACTTPNQRCLSPQEAVVSEFAQSNNRLCK